MRVLHGEQITGLMGAAQGQQHVGCSVTKCEFFPLETRAKRPREHGFMVGAGIEK